MVIYAQFEYFHNILPCLHNIIPIWQSQTFTCYYQKQLFLPYVACSIFPPPPAIPTHHPDFSDL